MILIVSWEPTLLSIPSSDRKRTANKIPTKGIRILIHTKTMHLRWQLQLQNANMPEDIVDLLESMKEVNKRMMDGNFHQFVPGPRQQKTPFMRPAE